MTNEIELGYYWAYVSYPREEKPKLEIIEYIWINELSWMEGESKEYEWVRCGSEIPIWPHGRINLVDGVRLTPPRDPVIFAEIKALEPQQAGVAMVEHIQPVRDNGN